MSLVEQDKQQFVMNAKRVYDEKLKDELERDYFGKIVGLEPESGSYELGSSLLEVGQKCHQRFGSRRVYYFRVGGGGAVRFGGALRHGRLPG